MSCRVWAAGRPGTPHRSLRRGRAVEWTALERACVSEELDIAHQTLHLLLIQRTRCLVGHCAGGRAEVGGGRDERQLVTESRQRQRSLGIAAARRCRSGGGRQSGGAGVGIRLFRSTSVTSVFHYRWGTRIGSASRKAQAVQQAIPGPVYGAKQQFGRFLTAGGRS